MLEENREKDEKSGNVCFPVNSEPPTTLSKSHATLYRERTGLD